MTKYFLAWMDESGVIPDLQISANELAVNYLDFNVVTSPEHQARRLHWDDTKKTLELGSPIEDIHLALGQSSYYWVENGEGSEMGELTAVRITGVAEDGIFQVGRASKDVYATAQTTLAITAHAIAAGERGLALEAGRINNIDTSDWNTGDVLWLDNAGALTNVRPTAGTGTALQVAIGVVLFAHESLGAVGVRIDVIPRLQALSDVQLETPEAGDIVGYNGSTGRFELAQSVTEIAWAFKSFVGSAGTSYYGGFLELFSGNDDFSPSITFGTANVARAAHFFVVLGEAAVDEISITVSGTSITDTGVRTTSDSEVITIPNGTQPNAMFETAKKWLGQITIETTGGTAKQCNYGFAKYWDNNNTNFTVRGFDVTWLGGAADTTPDIQLIHYKSEGWTYNAGAKPTPPVAESMSNDYSTDRAVADGLHGAYKRSNVDVDIDGAESEGTIWAVVATVNRTFEQGTITMRVTPR